MDWGEEGGTTKLEVVTIYRPTRVVTAVFCFCVALMMIVSIGPTDWVDTIDSPDSLVMNKEGLFKICSAIIVEDKVESAGKDSCTNQDKAYMKGVAALIIIGWILMLAAGGLITYGMLSHLEDLQLLLYRMALILSAITGSLLLIALVTFPIMVSQGLNATLTEASWSVGWAYMLDWASLVVIILIIVLLALDRKPDPTSVREKVVKY